MKSLLVQIENLIEEKVRDHIDATHHYDDVTEVKEIAVQKAIEFVTKDIAEEFVKDFAEPIIEARI